MQNVFSVPKIPRWSPVQGTICLEVEGNSTNSSIGANDTTITDTTDSESEDLTSVSGINDERSDYNSKVSVVSSDSGW